MKTYIVHMTIIDEDGVNGSYEVAIDARDPLEAESDAHLIATEGDGLIVLAVGPVEEVEAEAV